MLKEQLNENAIPSIDGDRGNVDLSSPAKKVNKDLLISSLVLGILIVAILSCGSYKFFAAIKGDAPSRSVVAIDPTLKPTYSSRSGKEDVKNLMQDIKKHEEEQKIAYQEYRKGLDENQEEIAYALQEVPTLEEAVQVKYSTNAVTGGKSDTLTPSQRKLTGKALIFAGRELSSAENQQHTGGLNDALQGSTFKNGTASILENRSLLLGMGSILPCVLKTQIITTYPSMPICQLTKNIFSNDGKTLLLEAGTMFFGEITKTLMQGQARVFVTWTTAETPKGVRVRIDALGSGKLGASGLPAWIDNHFFQRFGSALMLSFIDDALSTASQKIAWKNNKNVETQNIENTSSEMAKIALENSINIPPTAVINHGSLINIIVPRDVYFDDVYELINVAD